jgi:glycosyltransferase involved in cell wall biosynthesis
VIVGEGPMRAQLYEQAGGQDVRFLPNVTPEQMAELRRHAAVALVPSRSAETFGLAAAHAMAAGVPVVASRIGALPELVDEAGLVPPANPEALASAMTTRWGDTNAGAQGLTHVRNHCAPEQVATALAAQYDRCASSSP